MLNFQLESTKIADTTYAREYEEASLAMAKAKANLRAVEAENTILLQKAKAAADSKIIESEGKGHAIIIEAKSAAQARTIEAEARNEAASLMTNDFGREFALNGMQVDFAGALRANVLTVLPAANVQSSMLNISGVPSIPGATVQQRK